MFGKELSMKNNGFYIRSVGRDSWLLSRGDYPVSSLSDETLYIYPVKLNETGAYIWNQLDSGHTVEETAVLVRDRYGITYEEALGDVGQLAQDFVNKGYMYS